MSSNGFLHSLDIERPACWRVPALVISGLLLALAVLDLSPWPWQSRALGAALVLASALHELRRAWPGTPGYVSRLHVAPDGHWLLGCAREPQVLAPATLVHWWVVPGLALGLAWVFADGRRGQALLFRDRLPPEVWRRLQVRLRHRALPVAPAGARAFT